MEKKFASYFKPAKMHAGAEAGLKWSHRVQDFSIQLNKPAAEKMSFESSQFLLFSAE